ncbi:MAG: hypothetical protein HQK54_09485 [Oligoflexales bacterium]|nr:hypothetical protein [Oligoflexales bacterium]
MKSHFAIIISIFFSLAIGHAATAVAQTKTKSVRQPDKEKTKASAPKKIPVQGAAAKKRHSPIPENAPENKGKEGEFLKGTYQSKKPIEVKGQSRNLNMMLILKNAGDKIDFVKARENYHVEIVNTHY